MTYIPSRVVLLGLAFFLIGVAAVVILATRKETAWWQIVIAVVMALTGAFVVLGATVHGLEISVANKRAVLARGGVFGCGTSTTVSLDALSSVQLAQAGGEGGSFAVTLNMADGSEVAGPHDLPRLEATIWDRCLMAAMASARGVGGAAAAVTAPAGADGDGDDAGRPADGDGEISVELAAEEGEASEAGPPEV